MSDLQVGTTLSHGGQNFTIWELVDYFPEEERSFQKKATEGEADPLTLAKLLCVCSGKARVAAKTRIDAAGADMDREKREAILTALLAEFPKEVHAVQLQVRAGAPAHVANLKADAFFRCENENYCIRRRVCQLTKNEQGVWILPGTIEYPSVGDPVSHDSELDYKIAKIEGRFAMFKRGGREVTCYTDELVWFSEDEAWMLTGRLLSRADRDNWKVLVSSPWAPHPEKHPEARQALRDAGLMSTPA